MLIPHKSRSRIIPMLFLPCMISAAQIASAQTFPAFSGPIEQSQIQTYCAPATATYQGYYGPEVYMAYTPNDGSFRMSTANAYDGSTFVSEGVNTSPYFNGTVNASSLAVCSPAIAVFGANAYIAYSDENQNLAIWEASTIQNNERHQVVQVAHLSVGNVTTSPAMIVYQGKILIIYGTGSNHLLSVTSSTDGVNWTTTQNGLGSTGLGTSNAPALTILNNTLYMTFQQNNSQRYLWLAHTIDGSSWTATQYPSLAYGGAPAMTTWNNQITIAFQQNNSQRHLFVVVSSDGTNLQAQEYTNTAPGSAASFAQFNGNLYLYYKQNNSQNNLFYNVAP